MLRSPVRKNDHATGALAEPRAAVRPVAEVVDDAGRAGRRRRSSDGLDTAGTSLAEDVLDAVVPLLHPHQAEAEVDGEVADDVGRGLVA